MDINYKFLSLMQVTQSANYFIHIPEKDLFFDRWRPL